MGSVLLSPSYGGKHRSLGKNGRLAAARHSNAGCEVQGLRSATAHPGLRGPGPDQGKTPTRKPNAASRGGRQGYRSHQSRRPLPRLSLSRIQTISCLRGFLGWEEGHAGPGYRVNRVRGGCPGPVHAPFQEQRAAEVRGGGGGAEPQSPPTSLSSPENSRVSKPGKGGHSRGWVPTRTRS